MQEKEKEPETSEATNNDPAPKPGQRKNLIIGLFLTLFIVIAAMGVWMYFPVIQSTVMGTPTATSLPPTATATTTVTPTITPTPTQVPTPTATALPLSAFEIDPYSVYPPIPVSAISSVLLNEDVNISVEPAFDHPQWYSSDQISQQLGVVITEPFYATIGPGSALWKMDVPLQPGFYEIYILDTVYSSGGALDFRVFLGNTELSPLLGLQHVEYGTLSGNPPQLEDEWRSIGLYSLEDIDILSIATAWEAREMATIVAVDRVLIIRQPDSIWNLLSQLPANMPKYVVDDSSASIDTQEIWYTRSDLPAWGDQLQIVVNPQENSIITWQVPNPVPPGEYDIWIWAAPMEGDADVLYKVLVNGMENQGAMVASTGNMPENEWVSLGTWQAPSPDGSPIRLGLRLDIARGTMGEIAIDAVAFIFRQ